MLEGGGQRQTESNLKTRHQRTLERRNTKGEPPPTPTPTQLPSHKKKKTKEHEIHSAAMKPKSTAAPLSGCPMTDRLAVQIPLHLFCFSRQSRCVQVHQRDPATPCLTSTTTRPDIPALNQPPHAKVESRR